MLLGMNNILIETAEKEVQDTYCRGSRGGQLYKSPKIGGLGGWLRLSQQSLVDNNEAMSRFEQGEGLNI